MATIRNKGQFQWHVQVRKKGYPPQTRTFETKAIAEAWARMVESEMDRGTFVSRAEAERTTVNEALDRYAREILPTKKGRRVDEVRLKTLKSCFGRYTLASLTSSIVAKFRDARLKEVGPQSVIHELGLLNRVLKAAHIDWGIALPGGLPTAQIRRPKKPQGRDRRLESGELDALLEHAESGELRRIVLFALETSMRRGELCDLQWETVDLHKRVVKLLNTKNGESRTVPLSSRAIEVLQSLPRLLDGRVFSLRPDSITHAFDRACRRAGIVNLTFHDLRHEATSRLFELGLDMMEVSTITGHKTPQMLKRYTHLRAQDLARKLG